MLLTKVVAKDVVPRYTVAPDTKFVPFTVKVNAGPPCVRLDEERLVIVGTGAVIVRLTALDAVPPAFVAVIWAVPGCAMSPAGTDAVNWVALTNVVVKAVLLNETTAPVRKFVPFTVRVVAALPAITVDGEMLVRVGVGTVMVKLTALDAVPPAFVAVICAVPGCAMRLAGTAAVS